MTRPSVRSDSGALEIWRLIESWDAAPEFNMGLDEALLDDPEAAPTLRLYTWSPDTLSLGYFQKWADVPGTDRAGAVVRRITGGGAIHHTRELTFSIVLPQSHALFRGPVPLSYGRIHEALIAALSEFGVEASLAGQAGLLSDRKKTGMCFHESTPLDVAWGERKGVGSAQRRRGGRVLHHGSIKLGSTRACRRTIPSEPSHRSSCRRSKRPSPYASNGVRPPHPNRARRNAWESAMGPGHSCADADPGPWLQSDVQPPRVGTGDTDAAADNVQAITDP